MIFCDHFKNTYISCVKTQRFFFADDLQVSKVCTNLYPLLLYIVILGIYQIHMEKLHASARRMYSMCI